jgi:hypothetical protein
MRYGLRDMGYYHISSFSPNTMAKMLNLFKK